MSGADSLPEDALYEGGSSLVSPPGASERDLDLDRVSRGVSAGTEGITTVQIQINSGAKASLGVPCRIVLSCQGAVLTLVSGGDRLPPSSAGPHGAATWSALSGVSMT